MSLRFTILLACLIIGACAYPLEKRISVLREPADDVEYNFNIIYELDWR